MRFMLFVCDTYYPSGGVDDLAGRFDDQADAEAALLRIPVEQLVGGWAHLYDIDTDVVIARWERRLDDSGWDHTAADRDYDYPNNAARRLLAQSDSP